MFEDMKRLPEPAAAMTSIPNGGVKRSSSEGSYPAPPSGQARPAIVNQRVMPNADFLNHRYKSVQSFDISPPAAEIGLSPDFGHSAPVNVDEMHPNASGSGVIDFPPGGKFRQAALTVERFASCRSSRPNL